jgi:hypothetical protein
MIFAENQKQNVLFTYMPDAFRYRERKQENGELKIWKINPLKKVFASKFRGKFKQFFKAHQIIKTKKMGVYILPNAETGKMFIDYANCLKQEILEDLNSELERAVKRKDLEKIETIQKKKKYFLKHWEKIKPSFQCVVVEA